MRKNQILSLIAVLLAFFCLFFVILINETNNNQNTQFPIEIQTELPQKFNKSNSYVETLKTAEQEGKYIFLFFKGDWCEWCIKMEADTLSKPRVKKALSEYLIYYVDINKEEKVAAKYNFQSVPAYAIIDGKERIFKTGSGYKNETTFIAWLNTKIYYKVKRLWIIK